MLGRARPGVQFVGHFVSRVYASLPLTGPAARPGREVLRGAELALETAERPPVELVALDSFAEDREERAVANARRAVEDAAALAYLGDFHSSQVLETAPILGEAGVLEVAPAATFIGLEGPTLVRLMPHDGVGARAIADWLARAGVRELLVVHDHDQGYGVPVGAMCAEAARERGAFASRVGSGGGYGRRPRRAAGGALRRSRRVRCRRALARAARRGSCPLAAGHRGSGRELASA